MPIYDAKLTAQFNTRDNKIPYLNITKMKN